AFIAAFVTFTFLGAGLEAGAAQRSAAGTYSCGFESTSGYVAPGTSSSALVSGGFTLTLGKDGSFSQGATRLSVSDEGAGPAICDYDAGAGQLTQAPLAGRLGLATSSVAAQAANSALCPSGDATLSFVPAAAGLQFAYSNSSGFVGH